MPAFDRRIRTSVSVYWFPLFFSFEFEFVMSYYFKLSEYCFTPYIEVSNTYMDTIAVCICERFDNCYTEQLCYFVYILAM